MNILLKMKQNDEAKRASRFIKSICARSRSLKWSKIHIHISFCRQGLYGTSIPPPIDRYNNIIHNITKTYNQSSAGDGYSTRTAICMENPFDQIAYNFHIFSMRLVVNFKFICSKSLIWIEIICTVCWLGMCVSVCIGCMILKRGW